MNFEDVRRLLLGQQNLVQKCLQNISRWETYSDRPENDMKQKSEFKFVDQSCTRPVILTQFSLLYFISNFAFYFVFRELLRSQSNFEYHKPKSCMNEYPGNWTNFDQCKINPSFAAAGPQVSCNQLEQLKIESSAKFNTAQ